MIYSLQTQVNKDKEKRLDMNDAFTGTLPPYIENWIRDNV